MHLVLRPEQDKCIRCRNFGRNVAAGSGDTVRSRVEGTYTAGAGLVSTLLAAYMHNPRLTVSRKAYVHHSQPHP